MGRLLVLATMLAVLAPPTATATADPASLTAESAGAVVTGVSPASVTFPLGREGDLSYDTWVQYRTENGTALAGASYEAVSGSLLIPAGESEASIPVQALGASAYSPDKQFSLQLGAVGVGPTPSFVVPQTYPTGESPESVASADVNGDGREDLLVANGGDDSFSVRLNTTTPGASVPGYAPEQVFAAGRGPRTLLAADFDGDGRPDLVVVNNQFDERAISLFLNTTEPGSVSVSFAARQIVGPGANPVGVNASDLNGDGRLDLVVGNALSDYVTVLMNTTAAEAASPSFAPPLNVVAGDGTFTPQLTDLNGDGRPDLIVANGADQGKQAASVLLNTTAPGASSPSFTAPTEFAVEGPAPRSVAVADFNGDGRPDLAVASWGIRWLSVLLNTTAPGADTPSFAPQEVILGLPSGFKEWISSDDYNGDGKPDLALVSLGGANLSVLANTTPPGADIPSFFLAQNINSSDFGLLGWVGSTETNGDGIPDLVVAHGTANGKLSVLLNTTGPPAVAAPSFAAQQPFATGAAPSAIAEADLNGDGKRDLLVANQDDDSASVLLNTTAPGAAAPSFAAQQPFATGAAPSAIAEADVNGDGKRDLLVANAEDDTASVLLNTTAPGASSPSFAAATPFATGEGPSAIAEADVNGDGKRDLLVANRDDDSASVLLNTTAAGAVAPSFTAEMSFPAGQAPSAVVSADVNGDGKRDLLVANEEDDSASVLLNTTAPAAAAPSFATGAAFPTGAGPSGIVATDINGDGRADLLVANEEDDSASVLLNTTAPGAAAPSFAAATPFATGEGPSAIAEADVNGDGKRDLLVANEEDDSASVLLNTTAPGAAAPSFAAAQSFATGEGPSAIAEADVNGDGSPDLLTSNRSSDDVSILFDTRYATAVSPTSVTGTIQYAIPRLSLVPSPVEFGELLLGSDAERTVTLSNTGGAEMAIEGIAIDGPGSSQLSYESDCPAALPAGASCSIVLTFTATALGVKGAVLTVTSDAPSSPDVVGLSGGGYEEPPPPTPIHTLAVGLVGAGTGTVATAAISCPPDCSQSYVTGTQLALTANPAPGSTFAGWSGACSGLGSCQLAVNTDTTLTARFERNASAPARLQITRLRPMLAGAKVKVLVAGTIIREAGGVVSVAVRSRQGGRRLARSARVRIRDGRWRAHLSLAGLGPDIGGRKLRIVARFNGSPGVNGAGAVRSIRLKGQDTTVRRSAATQKR